MARMTKMEALEKKIEKAQGQVSRTKKQYDEATSKLGTLLDMREELQKEELIREYTKSDKSYDEVIGFLRSETDMPVERSQGSRRKKKR